MYFHPRYNVTNSEEQILVLYRTMSVYRNKITQYSNSSTEYIEKSGLDFQHALIFFSSP